MQSLAVPLFFKKTEWEAFKNATDLGLEEAH